DPASVSQKIKLTQPTVGVKGVLELMTCDDRHCLPRAEVPFIISVDASDAVSSATSDLVSPSETSAAGALGSISESTNIVSLPKGMQQDSGIVELDSSLSDSSLASNSDKLESGTASSVNNQDGTSSENQSLWGIFIAGLIGGFAAF